MIRLVGVFNGEFTGKAILPDGTTKSYCMENLGYVIKQNIGLKLSYRRPDKPNAERLESLDIRFEYNEQVANEVEDKFI